MHFWRISVRTLANSARAATPKGAELDWLVSGLLGIAFVLLVSGRIIASSNATGSNSHEPPGNQAIQKAPSGMAWIDGGTFLMGTNDKESFPNERPAHYVQVQGFWMDQHDVTNAEFSQFIEATRYVTTAERKVDWESLKKGASARYTQAGRKRSCTWIAGVYSHRWNGPAR
jgi:formylglycine-generating enzyme required for sulfatase activity